jgi:hypothetical protein
VTRSEELERWEDAVAPTLQNLIATLIAAGRSARQGPASLMAASDQLGAAARDARVWMSGQTCPIPDINDRLVRTMRSYRILARFLRDEADNADGPDVAVIDLEIDELITMIANTVSVLGDQSGL